MIVIRYSFVLLFIWLLPTVGWGQSVIESYSGATYGDSDGPTGPDLYPADISNCSSVNISFNFEWTQDWEGDSNMETPDECDFGSPCGGDPTNPLMGDCSPCWDFLWARVYLDGNEVWNVLIGDVGETRQSGTITLPDYICTEGASELTLSIVTQTWAVDEGVTFSDIEIHCYEADPIIDANETEFCEGDELQLDVIDTGSNNYTWSGPAGTVTDAYWEINDLTLLEAGTYSLTVTDDAMCSVTDEIEIEVYPTPFADLELSGPTEICVGNCTEIRIASFDTSYDLYYNLEYSDDGSHGDAFSGSDNYITVCLDGSGPESVFDEPTNTIHIPTSQAGSTFTFTLDGINLEVSPLFCDGDIGNAEVTIDLVSGISAGLPSPRSLCDEGGGVATFDLTMANDEVRNGTPGAVTWYSDEAATAVISTPSVFVTGDTIVYAVIDDGNCSSPPVPMDLMVTESEGGNIGIVSLSGDTICGDGNPQDIQVRFTTPNASIIYDVEYTYTKDGVPSNQSLTISNGVSNPSPTIRDVSSSLTLEITSVTISGSCDFVGTSDILNVNILTSPDIDPITDTISCSYYVLPVLSGSNLTMNSEYYTGSGGTGNAFLPGDTIFIDTTLYAYDQSMMCEDEETFQVFINDQSVIYPIDDQIACDSLILPAITGNNLTTSVSYYTLTGAKGNSFLPGDIITDSITLYIYDTLAICPPDEVEMHIHVPKSPDLSTVQSFDTCQQFIFDSLMLNVDSLLWIDTLTNDSLYVGDTIFSSGVFQLVAFQEGCRSDTMVNYKVRSISTIDPMMDISACDYYLLPGITGNNLSGQQAYYSQKMGAGELLVPGDTIFDEGWIYPYDTMAFCLDEPDSFYVTIEDRVDLSSISGIAGCDYVVLDDLGISVSDLFYTDISGIDTFKMGDTIFTTTDLELIAQQSTCKEQVNFSVVINSSPKIDDYQNVTSCDFYQLPAISGNNLSGDEAYYDTYDLNGQQYVSGDTLYDSRWIYSYDPGGMCPSLIDSFYIDIISSPDLATIDDVKTCDFWETDDMGVLADSVYIVSIPALDTFFIGDTISDPGLYGFFADIGMCQSDKSFNVNFDSSLSAGIGGEFDVCVDSSETLNLQELLTGNYSTDGVWTSAVNGPEFELQRNGQIRILQPGDYTFRYKVNSENCGSDSTEVLLHAGSISNAGMDLDTFLCVPRDVLLSEYVKNGNSNGSFYLPDGTLLDNDPIFLGETEELDVRYIDDSGTCGPDTANINIKNTSFEKIWWTTNQNTLCPDECVDITFYLESENTFTFYLGLLDDIGNQLTDTITLTENDSITYNLCNTVDGEISWGNVEPDRIYSFGMVDIFTNEFGCQYDVLDIDFAFSTGSHKMGIIESTLCRGDTLMVEGEAFHENRPEGEVYLPGGSAQGCDSIVMVSVQFEDNVKTDINEFLCEGDTLWVGETAYHANNLQGTEIFSLGNCDSIVNVNLTPLVKSYGEYNRTFCSDAGFYEVGGERFDIANPFGQVVLVGGNSVGCDSIVEVSLSFETAVIDTLSFNNCDLAFQMDINGTIYDNSNPAGTETFFGQASNGCDSIVHVNLSFESLSVQFEYYGFICENDSIIRIEINDTNGDLPLIMVADEEEYMVNSLPYYGELPWKEMRTLHFEDVEGCVFDIQMGGFRIFSDSLDLQVLELGAGDFELQLNVLSSLDSLFDINTIAESINWEPNDGLSCTDCYNPTASINGIITYLVTAITSNGCALTDSITLAYIVEEESAIVVPNVFSPNDDGYNDIWYPGSTNSTNMMISNAAIYDRWGNQVYLASHFLSNQDDFGWDGKYRGKELNPGVYVYVIEYQDAAGNIQRITGDITLIK